MLSFRLIRIIEDHSEQISSNVIQQVEHSPRLSQIRKLSEPELRFWLQGVAAHLGEWMAPSQGDGSGRGYEEWGRLCFWKSIPLHEAVDVLHIFKNRIIDFIKEQGFPQNSVEPYGEEELQRKIDRLFEGLIYYTVCGYELALQNSAHPTPDPSAER